MKTKIVFAVALLLMMVSVNGFTQSKPKMTEEQKKEMLAHFEAYKKKLNLTEEQAPEVQKINAEYFEALADLKKSDATKMEKLRKFRDSKSARDSKMKKVLSKEQYKMYTDFQAEMREELKENRKK
jgi:hypothetical protein